MTTRKKKTTSPADEAPTPQAADNPPKPVLEASTPEVQKAEELVGIETPRMSKDEAPTPQAVENLPKFVLDEVGLLTPLPANTPMPDNLVTVMVTEEGIITPTTYVEANYVPKLKVVAVNGKSGSGKTTTVIPHLCQRLNLQYIGTGDIFKAILGCLLTEGSLFVSIPHTRQVSPYALATFLESDFERGLRYYEELKTSKALDDASTVYFIELLRCMCPDIAVRGVVAMAKARGLNAIITDAFSREELEMLTSAVEVRGIVLLNCEDAKECDGNNRSLIAQSECDALNVPSVELRYQLGFGFDVKPYLDAISSTLEVWTSF